MDIYLLSFSMLIEFTYDYHIFPAYPFQKQNLDPSAPKSPKAPSELNHLVSILTPNLSHEIIFDTVS